MNLNSLFNLVDNLLGDISTFRGLTFDLDHGVFIIDILTMEEDGNMYLCDFIPHGETEPVSFAAKGDQELKDQISHYVLI